MGLHGLWNGLTVSLIYGAAVSMWMGLHAGWNRELEKVWKRLEAAEASHDEYRGHSGTADVSELW
jgi:hypothetical protein